IAPRARQTWTFGSPARAGFGGRCAALNRRSGTQRKILPLLAGEVGDPYLLGRPLARPLGAGLRVVGMIGSIGRGVELVQGIDEEAAAAQDLDPLAVGGVELDTGLRRRQAVCLALRVKEFAACGPVRSGGAHGDQDGGGVEYQSPPGRSSLAASGIQRAGSQHKLAPHSEMARSKQSEGSGTSAASASMSGKAIPNRSWQRRPAASWAGVTSTPVGRAPRRASQAEKYAVPQPSSTTSRPQTSPSTPSSCSGTLKLPQVMSSA